MKKINEISRTTWKGHEIETVSELMQITGGNTKMTTTKNATYYAMEGGGFFDDGQDDKQHENLAN